MISNQGPTRHLSLDLRPSVSVSVFFSLSPLYSSLTMRGSKPRALNNESKHSTVG